MTKGNELLSRYLKNENLQTKTMLLIGSKDAEWFAICSKAFEEIGFAPSLIFTSEQFNRNSKINLDYIYMAEGNTFQQLAFLKAEAWIPFITDAWRKGVNYIGVSAGAHIACKSIAAARDFDDAKMYPLSDDSGLGFFDGVIIPHFREDVPLRIGAKDKAIRLVGESNVLTLRNTQMAVVNASGIHIIDLDQEVS